MFVVAAPYGCRAQQKPSPSHVFQGGPVWWRCSPDAAGLGAAAGAAAAGAAGGLKAAASPPLKFQATPVRWWACQSTGSSYIYRAAAHIRRANGPNCKLKSPKMGKSHSSPHEGNHGARRRRRRVESPREQTLV